LLPNLLRGHPGQFLPGAALGEIDSWAYGKGFPAGHGHARIEPWLQVVAAFEELTLGRHDGRLCRHIGLHELIECHQRFLGVEGIAIEVKALDLPLLGLLGQRWRGRGRVRRGKLLGAIMGGLALLGAGAWDDARGLGFGHRISGRRRALRTSLGGLPGCCV
jgi:hypothetical protein